MNAAQFVVAGAGIVAAATVLLLMRHPPLRRRQFRDRPAHSLRASMLGAAGVLLAFALLAARQ